MRFERGESKVVLPVLLGVAALKPTETGPIAVNCSGNAGMVVSMVAGVDARDFQDRCRLMQGRWLNHK
jgi:hypothetical protein